MHAQQNLRAFHAPVKRKHGSSSIRRASDLKSRKFERAIRKALERRCNSEYDLRVLSAYEVHRIEIDRDIRERGFCGEWETRIDAGISKMAKGKPAGVY